MVGCVKMDYVFGVVWFCYGLVVWLGLVFGFGVVGCVLVWLGVG